jgi:GWxTD domain-containing protein
MKNIVILTFVFFIFSNLFAQMNGKRPTRYGFDINSKPPIYYDLYVNLDPENLKPRLKFLINIQNDLLFFSKTDEGYSGGYDIAISVKDTSKITVYSHLWKEKVLENSFEITNSKERYQRSVKSFTPELSAGKYEVFLELTDEISGNSYKSNREFRIPDINSAKSFTEIKFLNVDDSLSAEIIINNEKSIVELYEDIFAQLEIVVLNHQSISLNSELYFLVDEVKTKVRVKEYDLNITNKHVVFREIIDKIYIKEGNYQLDYKIGLGENHYTVSKKFSIIWYKKPVFLYDLELAIQPLHYILSEEQRDHVDNLSDQELEVWFNDYWKQKDPDPNTSINEIQVEFYERVMAANRKFSSKYYEGWDTDRGKALVLYGDPDRIEAHHYLTNAKPFEIWYYDSLNKKLTFIDVNEDDSFHLMEVAKIWESTNE